MASFTDKTPRFNPYIQQQPVEAMVSVGMHKQKAYEEGVQKIQTQIDNIAGLDVIRDVDKAYLQSKLNQLGNNLRTVASGDFSNFQLVNSVSGMTKQLTRDEGIVGAVASTAKYRKEIASIKEDEAAGKANPNNTKYFHKRANSWLEGTKPGEGLTESYFKPVDVWGKIKDIAKEVGVDESDIQQLYETDNNGKPILQNGKPVFSKVMTEKILKGKDPAKILKAFESGLGAAEYKQLSIDGQGNLEHLDSNALKERVIKNTSSQIDKTQGNITDLQVALLKENSKNKKNPDRINSLQEQIDYYNKRLDGLTTSRDNNLSLADSNPDAVRTSLWTNDYLHNMSTTLGSQEESIKYTANPGFQANMEINKFNFDIQRAKITDQHWAIEQRQKALDKEEELKYKREELWYKYGVGVPPGGSAVDLGVPLPEEQRDVRDAVETDYGNTVNTLNEKNYNLTLAYFKGVNAKKEGESTEAYDKRIREAITGFSKKTNEPINLGSTDINTFTARFAAKQQDAWSKDPKSVPRIYRDLHQSQEALTKEANLKKGYIDKVRKDALAEARAQGIDTGEYTDMVKKIKPLSLIMPDKVTRVNLSSQDIIDFALMHPASTNFFGGITVDKEQKATQAAALKRQTSKWGKNLGSIENFLYRAKELKPLTEGGFDPMSVLKRGAEAISATGDPMTLMKGGVGYTPNNNNLREAIALLNSSGNKKIREIENRLHQEKSSIAQPKAYPVQRGKENMDDVKSRISNVIDKYVSQGKINESEFSAEDIQAALIGGANAVRTVVLPGATPSTPPTIKLRITGKKGDTQEVTIDAGDFQSINGYPPPTQQAVPDTYRSLQYYNTTNKGGKGSTDPSLAGYTNQEFTNYKDPNFTLKGDLIPVEGSPGKYIFTMYKFSKKTGEYVGSVEYPDAVFSDDDSGNINQTLDYLPKMINKAVLDQLEKQEE